MSEANIVRCSDCGQQGPHRHLHDAAHGIEGTHMAGTERFECRLCGHAIYQPENQRRALGLPFKLDIKEA